MSDITFRKSCDTFKPKYGPCEHLKGHSKPLCGSYMYHVDQSYGGIRVVLHLSKTQLVLSKEEKIIVEQTVCTEDFTTKRRNSYFWNTWDPVCFEFNVLLRAGRWLDVCKSMHAWCSPNHPHPPPTLGCSWRGAPQSRLFFGRTDGRELGCSIHQLDHGHMILD